MSAFVLLKRLCVALGLMLAFVQPAAADPVQTAHVTADLVAPTTTVQPGTPFTVGLRLKMIPKWHTYWVSPGDTGLRTEIDWALPPGYGAGPIQWPYPKRLPLGPLVNYGYENEVVLASVITPPAGLKPGQTVVIRAHAKWLVCADVCVPEEGDFALELKAAAGPPQRDEATAPAFATAAAALPKQVKPWTFAAESTPKGYRLVATPTPGAGAKPIKSYFFSDQDNVLASAAAQPVRAVDGKFVISLTKAQYAPGVAKRLTGVWVADDGWGNGVVAAAVDVPVGAPGSAAPAADYDTPVEATATQPAPSGGAASLLGTLLLAFVGGLILNLMPCVFPVIGLKIMGFAHQGGQERGQVVRHGLAFTAGVLLSFWVLAGLLALLRAGGDQLGWGFQLQSPEFVFVLAAVLLAFGMNMSGAFEFGLTATGMGQELQQKSGISGSFFSGLLATLVATPCSAPFLAPALGAAVVLPTAQSFLVFTVIAIGLSSPYLLLSAFPQAVRHLPRPGAWMETFKQLMAFPLYATVVYLFWVLGGQLTDDALLDAGWALTALAFGLWAYGRWTRHDAPRRRVGLAVGLLLASAVFGLWLGWPRAEAQRGGDQKIVWEAWSAEAVQKLQAEGRPIYVDFTARWCATCQVNEALVFNSDTVVKAFRDRKIATLKADWTNKDPKITAELAKYGRSAIPFNLVYLPGQAEPKVLPEVLTPGIVLKAIGQE